MCDTFSIPIFIDTSAILDVTPILLTAKPSYDFYYVKESPASVILTDGYTLVFCDEIPCEIKSLIRLVRSVPVDFRYLTVTDFLGQ